LRSLSCLLLFLLPSSWQLLCLRLSWLVPHHHSHIQPLPCLARLLTPSVRLCHAFCRKDKRQKARQSLSASTTASQLHKISFYLAGLGRTRRRLAPLQGTVRKPLSFLRSLQPVPFRFSRRRFFLLSPSHSRQTVTEIPRIKNSTGLKPKKQSKDKSAYRAVKAKPSRVF
jgi:hypothetical protein